jgi:hypothetical protein
MSPVRMPSRRIVAAQQQRIDSDHSDGTLAGPPDEVACAL